MSLSRIHEADEYLEHTFSIGKSIKFKCDGVGGYSIEAPDSSHCLFEFGDSHGWGDEFFIPLGFKIAADIQKHIKHK